MFDVVDDQYPFGWDADSRRVKLKTQVVSRDANSIKGEKVTHVWIVDGWNFALHTNPRIIQINNDRLQRFLRRESLDQEPNDASVTVGFSERAVSFGYSECSFQIHGPVVVVDPYEMDARSDQTFQSRRWWAEELEPSLILFPLGENRAR